MNSRSFLHPLLLVFIILTASCRLTEAQHVSLSPDIVKGFSTGNSHLLSPHFNDELKISILSQEYDTQRDEAARILDSFFTEHKPVSFEVKFESEKKDSKFVIAVLATGNENFRVNIFFRKAGNNDVIQLLRIEKENEATF